MLCCCCCAAILVYCSVRDWRRICYVIGFENIRIHPSTRYQIHKGFIFSTLQSRFKNVRIRYRIRRMRVGGSRIRKEKLRINKYPDTCGRYRGFIAKMYQSDCSNSIGGPSTVSHVPARSLVKSLDSHVSEFVCKLSILRLKLISLFPFSS